MLLDTKFRAVSPLLDRIRYKFERPIPLDVHAEVRAIFPRGAGAIMQATYKSIEVAEVGGNARGFADVAGYKVDFDNLKYLELSAIRMAHLFAQIEQMDVKKFGQRRFLDFGFYFGNWSLAAALLGFDVIALELMDGLGDYIGPVADMLAEEGVDIVNSESADFDSDSFREVADIAVCMGVIEHIPHSPKAVIELIGGFVRPKGTLVLETPNLAYLAQRQKLARGESVFAPVEVQFHSDGDFRGHHREFCADEVDYMLTETGFSPVARRMFNYSIFEYSSIKNKQADDFRAMNANPEMREIIMAFGTKI